MRTFATDIISVLCVWYMPFRPSGVLQYVALNTATLTEATRHRYSFGPGLSSWRFPMTQILLADFISAANFF